MTSLAELFPPLGVTLTAGPLSMRPMTDDVLPALVELAIGGVHAPDFMPFEHPWTDTSPADLPRVMLQYHWEQRARVSPDDWALHFAVFVDDDLAGTQEIMGRHYLVTRSAETGSWLGLSHQRRGLGTLMRQTVAAFAFDHLDADQLTSSAFTDNAPSLGVSRKVGYLENGEVRTSRRGELAMNRKLVLTRDSFVRHGYPVEVEGVAAFRHFIGLDADAPETP